MKDLFKRIWNDPVGSKVIASVIIFLLGLLCSFLKSLISDDTTFSDVVRQILGFKVELWLVVVCLMVLWIVSGVVSKIREGKKRIPEPPFVNGFVKGRYQNQIWRWRWEWSPTNRYYYVADLNIECPNCHQGLLTLEYMNYRCAKCNADIPYALLNTTNDTVANQILEDARHNYSYCAKFLGKMPVAINKSILQ